MLLLSTPHPPRILAADWFVNSVRRRSRRKDGWQRCVLFCPNWMTTGVRLYKVGLYDKTAAFVARLTRHSRTNSRSSTAGICTWEMDRHLPSAYVVDEAVPTAICDVQSHGTSSGTENQDLFRRVDGVLILVVNVVKLSMSRNKLVTSSAWLYFCVILSCFEWWLNQAKQYLVILDVVVCR